MEAALKIDADSYCGASIVLYDGVCAMCNGIVRFVLKHDRQRRFFFAPLQDSFSREILSRHGRNPDQLDTMGVVIDHALPSEQVLVKFDAIHCVLEELGGPWAWLAFLLGMFPARLLNWSYGLLVRNRYRLFGRHDSCPLPSAEDRSRFVRPSAGNS